MERKPQARSPDLTHFRPSELNIEWVCHQDRKGGPASTVPFAQKAEAVTSPRTCRFRSYLCGCWYAGRESTASWAEADGLSENSPIKSPKHSGSCRSLTTGSLETFHHLVQRAPLPLSSGEHGKHLHTRAIGSIAGTSIPQGRGAWTLELAWYFLLKWFPANYQGFLCSL